MDEKQAAELKEAYQQLDDCIRRITTLEITPKGMVSDWVVSVGILGYDDDGDLQDTVEPILPEQGRLTPVYRVTGLLDRLLKKYDALQAHNFMVQLHDFEEDDEE